MTRPSLSLPALALLPIAWGATGPGRAAAQTVEPGTAPAADPARALSADLVMLPTVAVAIGQAWPVAPSGQTALVIHTTVGAVIGWPGSAPTTTLRTAFAPPLQPEERYLQAALWLQPEFGYSYQRGDPSDPLASGHLGSLGLGLGYGNLLFLSGSYTPRLVVGAMGGELAVGLRHGIAGHFLGRLFSAELSHQMLWVNGELRHELQLLFGLNAGALLVSSL